MERSFRGVWIPAEIYLDPRLTPTEIYLLAEIDSLDMGEGCDADNKYLSEFCRCDVRSISRFISHLRAIGLVNVTNVSGLRRIHRKRTAGNIISKDDKRRRFIPPTVEEVRAYCEERKNGIDAERFWDYYAARDWIVARGVKVYDWKACVRLWESSKEEKKENGETEEYMKHNYSREKLLGALVDIDKECMTYGNY